MQTSNGDQIQPTQVLIVGGGFAGLKCAIKLAAHPNIRITLIDFTRSSIRWPKLAAVPQQAGKSCAANIVRSIQGQPSNPFMYSDRGILAMIGRNRAIAELGKAHHEITEPVAFITWLGVHAALLTNARARLEAIVEWLGSISRVNLSEPSSLCSSPPCLWPSIPSGRINSAASSRCWV